MIEKTVLKYDADWIALSGGLDSSIIAKIKKEHDINGIAIITKDFIGTDLPYSQIVANHIKIPLDIKFVNMNDMLNACLLYTSPSPRDLSTSRMPSSA